MSADLIVYGLVAAGLIFWLRSILGTRNGNEKHRPSSYISSTDKDQGFESSENMAIEGEVISSKDAIDDLFAKPLNGASIANQAAKDGLLEISKLDKNFDVKTFLDRVQDAFVIIVECFSEGDRSTLGGLLGDSVYAAFDSAITEREKHNQTVKTEIHAIKKAEIIEARTDKKMAYITLRFVASETRVTKDKDGETISGHPDKITEMQDIWVFSRPLTSRKPRWILHETRGDFEGDNDIIPNSD